MTTLEEAQQIVESTKQVDAVYTNNFPEGQAEVLDQTQVLLTDNGSTVDAFGDDDFYSQTLEVELQVWYAQVDGLDYEAIETALLKAFTAQHWQVSGWRRRAVDPDTKQLFNTAYITRTANV